MSEDADTLAPNVVSSQRPRKKTRLLIGGGFLLLSVLAGIFLIWGLPGPDADTETASDQHPPTSDGKIHNEKAQKLDFEQAIEMMSGRYIPAHMNNEGRIVALGDCRHTYIEIDQESIHRKSGKRDAYREFFQTLSPSEQNVHPNAAYVFNAETEGSLDPVTKGSSRSIPQRRYSQYEIAYIEDESRTYLMIVQTDQFEHADGRRETVSSQGYYLPCPSQDLGGT